MSGRTAAAVAARRAQHPGRARAGSRRPRPDAAGEDPGHRRRGQPAGRSLPHLPLHQPRGPGTAVAAAIAATRASHRAGPGRPRHRAGGDLAGTRPQRRGRAQDRARRDRPAARPHRRAPGPGPRPGGRVDPGRHPAHHHREHHPQTASTAAHRRQPDPGRAAESRTVEPAVPGPARRRPRSPAPRPATKIAKPDLDPAGRVATPATGPLKLAGGYRDLPAGGGAINGCLTHACRRGAC